ncbi:MAG TPA: tetratricopeptide repeat protein [Methylomirabilota bacterium]|nr:tetratricopeptide repeat protein [Methylomirabilota bacterium]
MSTATSNSTPNPGLPSKQVFLLAAACLLVGLIVGYTFLGKNVTPKPVPQTTAAAVPGTMGSHPKLTLEQMKQMADVQASALIEKSKTEPKNAQLLIQIAGIYQATHQFQQAAEYFARALKLDPKNIAARTQMASCLYYEGDVDGALAQLNQALKTNPKDVNALFNLGMIKYRGKNDATGAIAAWEQLLKNNPNLDRKSDVEQLIAEAKSAPQPTTGAVGEKP